MAGQCVSRKRLCAYSCGRRAIGGLFLSLEIAVRAPPIHRLVLAAFVGAPPEGLIGCHNDGNKLNNHVSNLRWDTYSSNMLDAVKHGTRGNQTHCKHGHELTPDNIYRHSGGRHCRTCAIEGSKRRWAETYRARLAAAS